MFQRLNALLAYPSLQKIFGGNQLLHASRQIQLSLRDDNDELRLLRAIIKITQRKCAIINIVQLWDNN